MFGTAVLAYVRVRISMVVAELAIVAVVEAHVEENIRAVLVLPIILGMAALVRMFIVMCVRVDIVHLIVE